MNNWWIVETNLILLNFILSIFKKMSLIFLKKTVKVKITIAKNLDYMNIAYWYKYTKLHCQCKLKLNVMYAFEKYLDNTNKVT